MHDVGDAKGQGGPGGLPVVAGGRMRCCGRAEVTGTTRTESEPKCRPRRGPTDMCATRVNELITNDWRINGRIYRDPEIFDLEMEKIFGRVWVYLGHESELPAAGDYKTTLIGLQPVIVSRGADDER